MSAHLQTAVLPLVRPNLAGLKNAGVRFLPVVPAAGMIVAGRYELERQIGEGGMASVWAARDRSLDCPCALKLLHSEWAANPEVRPRFALGFAGGLRMAETRGGFTAAAGVPPVAVTGVSAEIERPTTTPTFGRRVRK